MKLLLKHGADPKMRDRLRRHRAHAGRRIGWVDGVTYERSAKENLEAIRMLLDLGLDPNAANTDGRTPLMGAALKGRNDVVQLLVERGAKLDQRDQRQPRHRHHAAPASPVTPGRRWTTPKVSFAWACSRQWRGRKQATLIRKMMTERGMTVPPENRTMQSICVTDICQGLPLNVRT